MRPCQICDNAERRLIFAGYDRQNMSLFECAGCGFRYVDSAQLNQAWFDNYYKTSYTTKDGPTSFDRYQSLARYTAKHAHDVLDIGGKNGELHEHFAKIQGLNYEAIGVGEKPSRKYECVILSHTLEHIYEFAPLFALIGDALNPGGLLIVEGPVHLGYVEPLKYDPHWQHVNKLRPKDLSRLFGKYGYRLEQSYEIPNYIEYNCFRVIGRKET